MDLEEFARTELRSLLQFSRVLTGDRGLAEDIVQEVLMRLHMRADRLASIDNLPAYARRMVVNEFVSWGRKWFRMVPTSILDEPAPQPDHADEHADRDSLRARLSRLPRKQQAVLALRYYVGLSDNQIADELGCSPGTVRTHASRGLATLRLDLADAPTTRELFA